MRVRVIFLAWALISAGCPPATAQNPCLDPGCTEHTTKIVRIGYTIFPPFSSTNARGTAQGYSIDLFRQFLEPQGYALSFVEFENPALLLNALETSQIDATSLLAINPLRAETGNFTVAFEEFSTGIFLRRGREMPETTQDLSGMRVGVVRGSLAARLLESIDGAIAVPGVNGRNLLIDLLANDIDAIASPDLAMQYLVNNAGLNGAIVNAPLHLNEAEAGVLVHPDRTVLLADLNRAIEKAQQGRQIEQLRETWFGPPPRLFSEIERRAIYLTAVVLAIALLLWAKAYVDVARRARALNARTTQLHAALDATGATFLLADASRRLVWWNEAFRAHHPDAAHTLETGISLEEHIARGLLVDSDNTMMTRAAAEETARKRIEDLDAGMEKISVWTTPEGRVLRQRMLKLHSGGYAAIATDVSELAGERDEIRRDAERLVASNKRLERFSQMVAHDLVSPMRNQKLLLKFIREDLSELDMPIPVEVHDSFKQAEELLARQNQLVDDLLEWSKNLHCSSPENFDPFSGARKAVGLAAVPEGFSVDLGKDMPRLHASPVAWELVLRNLISNAVKHHDRDQGEIRLTHRIEGDKCVFLLSDDGPGIPSEYLERIFEPFETLASKDNGGGSGIGLSFVREAVTGWGGNIEALDTHGGRGACFRLSVPLANEGSSNILFATPKLVDMPLAVRTGQK